MIELLAFLMLWLIIGGIFAYVGLRMYDGWEASRDDVQ
jgi:hypothetical protein